MRKTQFLLFTFSILSLQIFAQEMSREWGQVSEADIRMEVYDKDPEAQALVLYDVGETAFYFKDLNYNIRFTHKKRIKILGEAGLSYAEISLPYYIESEMLKERILSIEAHSFTLENDRMVKKLLDTTYVFEEKINEHWSARKFAIPNVKKGSIIEFRYELESPFLFKLPEWYFQDRIPTLFSRYSVKFIPTYSYAVVTQGIKKFDYAGESQDSEEDFDGSTSFSKLIKIYEMHQVPAFKDEAYISSVDDYSMKIDFQLARKNAYTGAYKDMMSTWPKLIKRLGYDPNFGKFIKKARTSSKTYIKSEFANQELQEAEKARLIIQQVKDSYKWNGEKSFLASQAFNSFDQKKIGNSADINLYLTAMLQQAGIKAYPVMLSTRDNGKLKSNYPFLHFFNYVVVLLDLGNTFYLTDASEPLLAYNRIPPRAINHKGLIIDKEGTRWIDLEQKIMAEDNKIIKLNIEPESLVIKTSVSQESTEQRAFYYRKKYKDYENKLIDYFLQSGFSSCEKVETLNDTETEASFIMKAEGETELESLGENLVLSPLLGFAPQKNELTQEERSYPVDFIYANTHEFTATLEIPENYRIPELPETYKVDNDLVEISIEYIRKEKFVEVDARYVFKKAVYQPEDYKDLKSSIDTIITLFNRKIVLEKM